MSFHSSLSLGVVPGGVDPQRGPEPPEGLPAGPGGDGDDVVDDGLRDATNGLLPSVARAQTHRPVDQVEHQEHDREYNKEHIINFGSEISKLL